MSDIDWKCSDCSESVSVSFGQTVSLMGFMWSASYQCANCGAQVEMDEIGFPPEEVRKRILEVSGINTIQVECDNKRKIQLAKLFVDELKIDLKQSLKAANIILKFGGIKGTYVEMEWLKDELDKRNIQSKLLEDLDGNVVDLIDLVKGKLTE